MARSPNSEQLVAIEVNTGALLSAGAGSGKTFVIVEHLLYLIEKRFKNSNSINLKNEIGEYLNKIILMTFTKKASGEMLVRLIKRVEEKVEEDNGNIWNYVLENITKVKISTIHGFCHSLISEGTWPNYPSKFELLNKTLHVNKINKIFNKWYLINKENLPDQMLAHVTDLLKGIVNIFESPDLRLMWKEQQTFTTEEEYLNSFFNEFINLFNFHLVFNSDIKIEYESEQLKKQGFALINDFQNLYFSSGKISSSNYLQYLSLQESLSRFPSATKDMNEADKQIRIEIKMLFDELKKIKNDLKSFSNNFKEFKKWEFILKDAFEFIDQKYLLEPGLTFSDLEYYVLLGLRDKEKAEIISKKFEYLIVDEFQDTSPIQFEIIKRSVNNNFNKLFCVGDKKQAIYGFRGGELRVFNESAEEFGQNRLLNLHSNYRSNHSIIKFNNAFFKHLLPLGKEYEGLDAHSVQMDEQTSPNLNTDGVVEKINLNVAIYEKELDVDKVEALGILESIKQNIGNENFNTIAVLYKKLSPSRILIDLLIKEDLDFAAQVKISIEGDPIFSIFQSLISYVLNTRNIVKKDSTLKFLQTYLEILNIKPVESILLDKFQVNIEILGLEASFLKFLYDLNISDSLYKENIELISNIIASCEGDLVKINQMIDGQGGDYSFELSNGMKKKIQILTVHTSKGLEYDCVIMGGIQKNGKYEGLKDKVGKLPNSFKWKASFDQKEYSKSPAYLLESMILSAKDFSESKRLLYVACTRAVKKLIFLNVINNGKEKSSYSNSWINGFRSFDYNEYLESEINLDLDRKTNHKTDLYFKDSLGILPTKHTQGLSLISELSVTRLAVLVECPFKFYLKNICKIGNEFNSFDNSEEQVDKLSSLKRGTAIHHVLAGYIKDKIKNSNKYDKNLNWLFEKIDELRAYELNSEKEIKFSFMGHMITAIPDLFFKANDSYEIWDFKTGSQDKQKENSYWFQLMVYAYGISNLEFLNQEYKFNLKLIYIDEEKIENKTLELKEIIKLIKSHWEKVDSFNQVNNSHCASCEYQTICKYSNIVAST